MKYMGSKNRHSKYIIPFIQESLKHKQKYIEPFVGGCNIIDKIDCDMKIGNDKHKYLISMWKELQKGWIPKEEYTYEEYIYMQNNKEQYPEYEVGYVGFNSYGGTFFNGYRRDSVGKRNYWREHFNNIIKQKDNIKNATFICYDYRDLNPIDSVVYCDPPYSNTRGYYGVDKFNGNIFWDWILQIKRNNIVYVSEYNCPIEHEILWNKTVNNTLEKNTGNKQGIEYLYKII